MLLGEGSSSRSCAEKVDHESLKRREGPAKCFETAPFEDEERLDRITVAVGTAEPTVLPLQPQGLVTLWTCERFSASTGLIVHGHRFAPLPTHVRLTGGEL
jgi:hypothetical protein